MREVCFCGRIGEVEDREPVTTATGAPALRCPEEACGHIDRLEWLSEETRNLVVKVAARRSARLASEVSGDGTVGTLLLGGEEHAFSASPAEEPAGLYRKEETVDGEGYVGGWILLESGEERGAVRNNSTGFMGQDIELARP